MRGHSEVSSGRRGGTWAQLGSAVFVFGLLQLGCESPSGPERGLSGKRIYDRNCARCHGLDGRPTAESPSARDLSNASYVNGLSDEAIRRVIEGGKPPGMPSFGGQFMEPSMKLIISYVRDLSRPPAARGASKAGD